MNGPRRGGRDRRQDGPGGGATGKAGAARGDSGRGVKTSTGIKTAKGRSVSSTRWLARQLADPFVAGAKARGYRSRAAFKLAQMDDRFEFLKHGARVVDLGAAPGGWTQVALERCGRSSRVIAVDLGGMEPLEGAVLLTGDVRDGTVQARLTTALGGPATVVLSDMAAPATGHAGTDHLRVMALAETAYDFAEGVLAPGGAFVVKVLRGGTEADLLERLKRAFDKVRHVKPPASRPDSAELYLFATGFRGGAQAGDQGAV